MTGKELGKQPVFPIIMPPPNEQGFYGNVHDYGLTKREEFAKAIMAEIMTDTSLFGPPEAFAADAVAAAEVLLDALAKDQ